MSEIVANNEKLSLQEVESQKNEFLKRAAALPGLFDNSDLPSMEARAQTSLTLRAPKGWEFSLYRSDETSFATTMGRFSDYDSAVGSKDFDRDAPLRVNKIEAAFDVWPAKDNPQLTLTFETSEPDYYDSYTHIGDPSELVIDVIPAEN